MLLAGHFSSSVERPRHAVGKRLGFCLSLSESKPHVHNSVQPVL